LILFSRIMTIIFIVILVFLLVRSLTEKHSHLRLSTQSLIGILKSSLFIPFTLGTISMKYPLHVHSERIFLITCATYLLISLISITVLEMSSNSHKSTNDRFIVKLSEYGITFIPSLVLLVNFIFNI
jgi:hypothetical protein